MDDTSDDAVEGTDQTDQAMQQDQGGDGADTGTDQPVISTPAPSPVPTAPAGNFDQDMNHLMIHLGDLKAFLARWEHNAGGKVGEVVAYLKAIL